ncbi:MULTISPECIES: type III secretion system needle length determinant [Pseudomonas]|uniref:type III secretion system needle length determinant n=1 Tax=Pseudomonas TaxID=286 RepID=UPI000A879C03|nr:MULTISPECIES: type III secretion system needle length determinant [Pseudomonas]QOF93209.1 type III secretion system needle length determinant [Pseudomonas lundensis]
MTRISPVEPSLPGEAPTPMPPEKALQQHFEQALLAPRVNVPTPLRPTLSALGRSFQQAHHAFAQLLRGPEPQATPAPPADEQHRQHAAEAFNVEDRAQRPPVRAMETLKPAVDVAEGCEPAAVHAKTHDHAQPLTAAQLPARHPAIDTLNTVADAAEPAEPARDVMPEGVSLPFAAQQPAQIPPFHTAAVAAEPAKHVKPEGDTQPLTAAPLTLREALKTIVSIAAGDVHPVDSHGAAAPVAPANDSRAQDDPPQDEPTRDLPLVDDPPDAFAALMTPGDKLLARLQPTPAAPVLTRDVQQLLSALQPHIQCAVTPTGSASVVQVHLPQLGHVEVQLVTIHGQLQVDIQASPGSLLQLQLARHELLERLQRVSPEQPVHLSFSNAQDGDQRSRQRRSVYDEWEPQP